MKQCMTTLKKHIRPLTVLLLLTGWFLLGRAAPCCARQPAETPADMFAGETLHYRIDFWLLRGSARGELCFSKTSRGYRAYFEAETRGLLRAIGGARKEIMESVMDFDWARQRLRPRLFREMFMHNDKVFSRTVSFDYDSGSYTCTRSYPRGKTRSTRAPLPDGTFEDMLSLYYNFRMGCYGTLPESGTLSVPVIMKEQPSVITIAFPPPGSKERRSGFSAILSMTRDLTHAFSRRVLTALSSEAIMTRALVVDAYLFGDLEVHLTGIGYY